MARQNSGRNRSVSDAEIIRAVETAEEPVATTSELTDVLPIGERGLRDRLQELADESRLATKRVGRSRVWYSAELPLLWERAVARRDRPDDEVALDELDAGAIGDAPDGVLDVLGSEEGTLALSIRNLDLPGSGAVSERREELVVDVVKHIRETGSASRAELLEDVVEDRLGAVGYGSGRSAWKNLLQPALHDLSVEVEDLVSPGEGGRRWMWAGVPERLD